MSNFSERELDLIIQARRDERQEILTIIKKFVRTTELSDGDTVSEIKVPANHLMNIIEARGHTNDHILTGIVVDPTVLPE